jgi:hypothetical protein
MLPTDIPEVVLARPRLLVALTVVVVALAHWQAGLTYREYRLAHRTKTWLFAGLDARAGGYLVGPIRRLVRRVVDKRTAMQVTEYIDGVTDKRPLVRTKAYRDSASFVRTVDAPSRAVFDRLTAAGDPHLVATVKRRAIPGGGYQWAHAQVVFRHADGTQTEAFIFDNKDGTTDVYAHVEGVFTDPRAHLSDEQREGDGRGAVAAALDGETPDV